MLPWKGILHMHNANDQILSLLYPPPKVSELKRSGMDAKALCYWRLSALSSPRRHTTLLPTKAPGDGIGGINQTGTSPGEEEDNGLNPTPQGPRAPAFGEANYRPGRRRPWSGRGWRFPLPAESRPALGRDLTWVLPTCAARYWNSGQLFTKVRAALPPLTPNPQVKTQRSFREAGPRGGRREREEEVASIWQREGQDSNRAEVMLIEGAPLPEVSPV